MLIKCLIFTSLILCALAAPARMTEETLQVKPNQVDRLLRAVYDFEKTLLGRGIEVTRPQLNDFIVDWTMEDLLVQRFEKKMKSPHFRFVRFGKFFCEYFHGDELNEIVENLPARIYDKILDEKFAQITVDSHAAQLCRNIRNFSAHGICLSAHNYFSKCARVLWLLLFGVMFILIGIVLTIITMQWIAQETVAMAQIEQMPVDFPAVTICNNNPYRYDYMNEVDELMVIVAYFDQLRQAAQVHEVRTKKLNPKKPEYLMNRTDLCPDFTNDAFSYGEIIFTTFPPIIGKTNATLVCKEGYTTTNEAVADGFLIQCTTDGLWFPAKETWPKCEQACGAFPNDFIQTPRVASFSYENNNAAWHSLKSTAKITCIPYSHAMINGKLTNSRVADFTCFENGKWYSSAQFEESVEENFATTEKIENSDKIDVPGDKTVETTTSGLLTNLFPYDPAESFECVEMCGRQAKIQLNYLRRKVQDDILVPEAPLTEPITSFSTTLPPAKPKDELDYNSDDRYSLLDSADDLNASTSDKDKLESEYTLESFPDRELKRPSMYISSKDPNGYVAGVETSSDEDDIGSIPYEDAYQHIPPNLQNNTPPTRAHKQTFERWMQYMNDNIDQIPCDISIKNEVAEKPLLLIDALEALRKITDLFQMQDELRLQCIHPTENFAMANYEPHIENLDQGQKISLNCRVNFTANHTNYYLTCKLDEDKPFPRWRIGNEDYDHYPFCSPTCPNFTTWTTSSTLNMGVSSNITFKPKCSKGRCIADTYASVECEKKSGQNASFSQSLKCDSSGKWIEYDRLNKHAALMCRFKCDEPDKVEHSTYKQDASIRDKFALGAMLTYECDKRSPYDKDNPRPSYYISNWVTRRYCTRDFEGQMSWQSTTDDNKEFSKPTCGLQCPIITIQGDEPGKVFYSDERRLAGSKAALVCQGENSVLTGTGQAVVTCNQRGFWSWDSDKPPVCKKVDSTLWAIMTSMNLSHVMNNENALLFEMEKIRMLMMPTINTKILAKIGHAVNMFTVCRLMQKDCIRNISTVLDPTMGNCFKINNGEEGSASVRAYRPGPMHGLTVHMIVDSSTYVRTTDRLGIKVLIHPRNATVTTTDGSGIFLPTGYRSLIGIKREAVYRINRRSMPCAERPLDSRISFYYTSDYSMDGCLHSCEQLAKYKHCNCTDSRVPPPPDVINRTCDISNYDCLNSFDFTPDDFVTKCYCPQACTETTFDKIVSYSQYPANANFEQLCNISVESQVNKTEEFLKNQLARFNENIEWVKKDMIQRCYDDQRTNSLVFDIYYRDDKPSVVTERLKLPMSNYFSFVGSVLSLGAGMSLISFVEFVIFIFTVWRKRLFYTN